MSNFADLAEQHRRLGDQYAVQSRRFRGELADAYDATAEAHHYLSKILAEHTADAADEPPAPKVRSGTAWRQPTVMP